MLSCLLPLFFSKKPSKVLLMKRVDNPKCFKVCTVKVGDKERFDKEPFPLTNRLSA